MKQNAFHVNLIVSCVKTIKIIVRNVLVEITVMKVYPQAIFSNILKIGQLVLIYVHLLFMEA